MLATSQYGGGAQLDIIGLYCDNAPPVYLGNIRLVPDDESVIISLAQASITPDDESVIT